MRMRMVTICLLAALCLVRPLTDPGGGQGGAGPPEASGAGWPGATGRTDGPRGADGRMAAWPSCGGRSPPCDRVRPPRDAWSAVVRRVVDGDTVILLARGRS